MVKDIIPASSSIHNNRFSLEKTSEGGTKIPNYSARAQVEKIDFLGNLVPAVLVSVALCAYHVFARRKWLGENQRIKDDAAKTESKIEKLDLTTAQLIQANTDLQTTQKQLQSKIDALTEQNAELKSAHKKIQRECSNFQPILYPPLRDLNGDLFTGQSDYDIDTNSVNTSTTFDADIGENLQDPDTLRDHLVKKIRKHKATNRSLREMLASAQQQFDILKENHL